MNRNLWILIISQIFSFTPGPVNVFLSGIVGNQLAINKSFATIPTALLIVGTASFSFFAAKIMSIIGRRLGFVLAGIASSISCLIAAYSIKAESFFIFCVSCFILGAGMAFIHQYRFAAAESVEKENAPKAIGKEVKPRNPFFTDKGNLRKDFTKGREKRIENLIKKINKVWRV